MAHTQVPPAGRHGLWFPVAEESTAPQLVHMSRPSTPHCGRIGPSSPFLYPWGRLWRAISPLAGHLGWY
eukprot:1006434-Prorocentrum_lima.AAC.1